MPRCGAVECACRSPPLGAHNACMAERVDTVVIGAGVVGLACARALAMAGHEVVLLEALHAIGQVTSARNSEVIHAGLYYPTGSLKARMCVQGKHALYAYAASHHIPHRRCGKLVVAADASEWAKLQALQAQAAANGVDDVIWLDAAQTHALEPALAASAALLSPSTGIIDSHALMLALRGDAEGHGAILALGSPLQSARALPGAGFELHVGGAEPMHLHCRRMVNAAGLDAIATAQRIEGLDPAQLPNAQRCKGHYFALSGGKAPFTHLIYPTPQQAGLGIHYTLDLAGQGRFGPDVQWISADGEIDYAVDASRASAFEAAIRRYWPGLPGNALMPAYSGVRPKIVPEGAPAADFLIQGPAAHGLEGLVNLFGIESPGLTACLAIADEVAALLR
jgi:L-2-hydroxyglutarate oxidase LhgO